MDHASTSLSTLEAWIEDFLTAKQAETRSGATLRAYRQRLFLFHAWFVEHERPLDRTTLRAYLAYLQRERENDRRLSATTVASYFRDVTIRAYLDTRTDADPALWLGRWGPLTANGVHQAVQRRAERAGIHGEVRRLLHGFRATFAKHYVMRGGDLESLRKLLGHNTIAVAAHYAQLADDELAQKKAAVDPLAAVFEHLDPM